MASAFPPKSLATSPPKPERPRSLPIFSLSAVGSNRDRQPALDESIDRLRAHAERFDMIVETVRGHVIEAQGRVSGGRAFVRFVALSNVRAELAELKTERDRLLTSLDTFQALLDVIDMPVWLRGPDQDAMGQQCLCARRRE
jgi:hypothetical protein